MTQLRVTKIAGYEIHPAAALFPMLDDAALQRLADDIKANGLKVPVVLLDGKILDGRNRLLACERAGVTPRIAQHDGANPWRAVWSLNAERRQIEDKVRLALIGKRMLEGSDEWEARQAKARDEANRARSEKATAQHALSNPRRGETFGRASQEAPPKREYSDGKNKTASRLAAEVGVSRATVERAMELERRRPEAANAVVRGEIEGAAVLSEIKREERMRHLADLSKNNAPLPDGSVVRYPIIYADPPWQYDFAQSDSRAIENQYPTMTMAALSALAVRDIATPDAVLFLWATSPKLVEALALVVAWGFDYKTCMVWVKDRVGMGYYARQRHELLLIATRGNPPAPAPNARPDSVIEAPRGVHSAKPDAFAIAIESMYPDLPRLEMFRRKGRPGWVAWGNEAACTP